LSYERAVCLFPERYVCTYQGFCFRTRGEDLFHRPWFQGSSFGLGSFDHKPNLGEYCLPGTVEAWLYCKDRKTEEREFSVLESIQDNHPKYVLSMDPILRNRSGIVHKHITDFLLGFT